VYRLLLCGLQVIHHIYAITMHVCTCVLTHITVLRNYSDFLTQFPRSRQAEENWWCVDRRSDV